MYDCYISFHGNNGQNQDGSGVAYVPHVVVDFTHRLKYDEKMMFKTTLNDPIHEIMVQLNIVKSKSIELEV